jgi:hypothetical protein
MLIINGVKIECKEESYDCFPHTFNGSVYLKVVVEFKAICKMEPLPTFFDIEISKKGRSWKSVFYKASVGFKEPWSVLGVLSGEMPEGLVTFIEK